MAQLKKPTTYQEQIALLKSRNIQIDDSVRCAAVLENVNYYRFTAYFLPFKQSDGLYREGTQFVQVYQIYEFDRKLRSVLFAALGCGAGGKGTISIQRKMESRGFTAYICVT